MAQVTPAEEVPDRVNLLRLALRRPHRVKQEHLQADGRRLQTSRLPIQSSTMHHRCPSENEDQGVET